MHNAQPPLNITTYGALSVATYVYASVITTITVTSLVTAYIIKAHQRQTI
jgi:hypothetical protein